MKRPLHLLVAVVAAVASATAAAQADDKALLIQLDKSGVFRVWHSAGTTTIGDDDALALAAGAKPEGGDTLETDAGPARAYETDHGIVIDLPRAKSDRTLLIDRDNCGALKIWHAEGVTNLTDDQLADLVMNALPGGGARVAIGDRVGRPYLTELGVIAVLWKPVPRSGAAAEPALKPPSSAR